MSMPRRATLGLLFFAGFVACSGDGTAPDQPPVDPPPPTPPPATQPPTQAATGLSFSDVTATSMRLSWTSGNGDGRLVLARERAVVDATPADGTSYGHDSRFGLGDEVGTGNFVVYSGPASNASITELTPDASYFFAVYEFNGSGGDIKYQTGDRASGDRPTDDRPSDLIGSWFWGATPGAKLSAVFTALDEEHYMIVDDGVADGGGGPGVERGPYRWDRAVSRLTAQPTTDTSGDWGLSGLTPSTLMVNGDELTVSDGVDTESMSRVVRSPTNPLVGSWVQTDSSDPSYLLIITFLDDTHWMLGVDDTPSPTGGPGMEQGTYQWDRATGQFSAAATSDTSGDTGLNPDSNTGLVVVRGNLLIYTEAGGSPTTLRRVH